MKFWQRAFLSTLLLFIICFFVSIFLVSNFSYRSSLNSERERSFGEAYFIANSLERDILAITQRDGDISAGGYSFFLAYANYYKNREVYLELWKNGVFLIGNIPNSRQEKHEARPGDQIATVVEYSNNKYMQVVSAFYCDLDGFTLVYAHSLEGFTSDHNTLINFLILSGVVLAVILAIGLYVILRRLSKPIERLDEATGRISGGDYTMRVPAYGNDELTALAWHFNSMADEIEAKIRELQTTAEQKQRFIDNLAHELRTPLTTIRGYAEYLKNGNISEDDRIASIDQIISESARIDEMSNKLLDLALLRNNALEFGAIDVLALLTSISEKAYPKLAEKGIQIKTGSEISSIDGDKVLLENLLMNLLANAIEASDAGSSIELSGKMENGCNVISIKDYGKGISEEHIAMLAEPFYRVDKARSRADGGAGLGLAICEQIAKLHNAQLIFESSIEKGTTAKLVIDGLTTQIKNKLF